MKPPLILIDGSSYFFRAFHALPPLMNSKGRPTGAVYGVANMVKKLMKDYDKAQIIVVFDAKGKNFRHALYPEYKAHRPLMAEDLACQFQPLLEILKAMGLPLIMMEGVEADDIIGTLTTMALKADIPVVISTGDKDMAQLVNEKVTLINTMTNQIYTIEKIFEKFGVFPHQMIDYLALIGDTVDNIPGIPKCGPKTAAKWLLEYQTMENLLAKASEIGGKIGENLRESSHFLPLSKKLVTIQTDLPLTQTLEDLVSKTPDKDALIALTQELEFKNWLKELLAQEERVEEEKKPAEIAFQLITDLSQLDDLLSHLAHTDLFAVDLKTTGDQKQLIGMAIAVEGVHPWYIPFLHQDGSQQLAKKQVLTALKPILENPMIKKAGKNLKFEWRIFKNYGINLQGIAYDTMLESYLFNSSSTRHDLDSLALKYLGYKTIHFEDLVGKGMKQIPYEQTAVANAAPFAAEDADISLKLHTRLYPLLVKPLITVLETIEIPLITVLGKMERHGVLIDIETLKLHGKRLKSRMIELEKEAYAIAGRPFNLNSPKQLQVLLFDELKLPILAKTPKGQPSTAESVLQDLAYDYRLPSVILEYRSCSKLVSTYIDALPRRINPETGRVHTSYNQAVAATGRLSSSDPNLQNIPIRNEEGRLIRKAFIAPPGFHIVACDYSQIELRIMAHLSRDKGLLEAFANDWDIHTATAAEIFETPLHEVSKEQRRRAKAVNFGLIYGMSAFGLSRQLAIDRKEAQLYMDLYFQRYPGVLQYMEETRQFAHQNAYVETLFGRRLYLPEINVKNLARQKAAERMAINAPMQGTAADIIKKAMIALAAWQETQDSTDCSMIMQVHDELVFEVKDAALEKVTAQIQHLMENTVTLSVPLKVSVGIGLNWDEAH